MKSYKLNKLSVAILLATASVVPVYAGTALGTAESGGAFAMPALTTADITSSTSQTGIEIRTGIPLGEKNLVDLKSQSEALTAETTVPVAPAMKKGAVAPDALGTTGPGPLYASSACNVNIATGFAPSDIHGAVGPSRLVVTTNVDIGVYNKVGCSMVSRVPLTTLFSVFAIPSSQTLFDPRTIYDRSAGRFFVTAESRDSTNTNQYQYFAVSKDSTASAWWVYRATLSQGTSFFCKKAANSFWDYPNTGKSASRWFIAANDFGSTVTGAILAIDKAPSLSGTAPAVKCFNNLAVNIAPPIVLDSSTQSVFLAPNTATISRYNHTKGATVGADTLALGTAYNIADWTLPPDAVQPNGQKLDSIDGRFQSASIQSRDRIWNIHTVNSSGRPLIRWYRLQRSASNILSTVTFQAGTATSHLFNPSFVTNSGVDGSPAFITASRTDPACSTSSCLATMVTFSGPNNSSLDWTWSYAGFSTSQFATDGFGTACNSTSRGSCRWGDYSSITVDPYDAGHAWGFNQLINGTTQFNWFTRGTSEIYNLQY